MMVLLAVCCSLPMVAAVPTPEQFLGYPIGTQFTPHHRILAYYEELQRKAPELISLEKIGETYEGRPLMIAVITSVKNRADLAAIRADHDSISHPERTSAQKASQIAAARPTMVWLAFGVHGDESSSAEASMLVVSRLLSGDEESKRILENVVIVIDPLENPDGRERYLQFFRRASGMRSNPNPDAMEHQQPWPSGRFNHYFIDMNRDWAWGTQKETRARVAAYQQWNPQTFVDFHEMSYESNYFFPPDAHPINSNIAKETKTWLGRFGEANAKVFSEKGWPFFVGERFDLFYPGYGDSWPSLRGAIGMTYEVAGGGRGGTVVKRQDSTLLTLTDRAERHYSTAMATLATAASNRSALIQHTYDALAGQLASARSTYFIPDDSPSFLHAMALLTRQGIEVGILRQELKLRVDGARNSETRTFAPGTAVITTRQRLSGLAQTLLEKSPELSREFIDAQRKRVDADESDEFYDITSWSVPVSHNLQVFSTTAAVSAPTTPWSAERAAEFKAGRVGYLVSVDEPHLYKFIGRLLTSEIRFSVAAVELKEKDRRFAPGSLVILKNNNNAATLDETLGRIVRETGTRLTAVDAVWSGGVALGSEDIRFVRTPRIGIVGGEGVNAPSFGMIWQTFDVETEIPHSVLPLDRLRSLDLTSYNVLILPDGSYADRLGKKGIEKLAIWVRAGGTLIAIKSAAEFLREKDVELSKLKTWTAPVKKEGDAEDPVERANDFRLPGTAFRTTMDVRSALTFGISRSPDVLLEGSGALLPLARRSDNIVVVEKKDPLSSGFAWPESVDRVKGSVYLAAETAGAGTVITFADEPFYRLFWRGTLPLLLNAAVYGPTFRGE